MIVNCCDKNGKVKGQFFGKVGLSLGMFLMSSILKLCLELFGKRKVKRILKETLKSDKRFIKCNLILAMVFLGYKIDIKPTNPFQT